MSRFTVILVAAVVLDAAVVAFFFPTDRDPAKTPVMVAIVVAAVVTVGATILFIQRTTGRELATVRAETNAALRALAQERGLEIVEAPTGTRTGLPSQPFAEARGVCAGARVRVRAGVESIATDELSTALSFPGRTLDDVSLRSLAPLVDRADNRPEGLVLYLGKRPEFWKPFLLSHDRLPETDPARLIIAFDRACALLTAGTAKTPGDKP